MNSSSFVISYYCAFVFIALWSKIVIEKSKVSENHWLYKEIYYKMNGYYKKITSQKFKNNNGY